MNSKEASTLSAENPDAPEITLRDDERQPCEVWTRVMGYHRPTTSFNVGKQGEHAERKFFVESKVEKVEKVEKTGVTHV
ncbi:MAG: anaerobic ribonucleoside-triphosphate reductase [Acidithiobacillus sp.]|jgi:hypothetical protein|uniref:anaerobic ribonucleoside-triphosphate reductase n=1 Tax=Acidithiobacillus ferrooxidans TaxID=920 RepID=UPI000AF6E98A|nr:anaerobic ribonucleoside-triphosphate reductase [Acidithiobacillus ferrooxidans]